MGVAPIVAGTDGSARAEVALNRAAELARALGAPVHLVTGYSLPQGAWMASANGVPVGELLSDGAAREHAEAIVERARARLAGLGVTAHTHVCASDPGKALVTIAEGHGAQMIVVGNRGMSGARRVLGSVPNYVSHHASCGVLIVPTDARQ